MMAVSTFLAQLQKLACTLRIFKGGWKDSLEGAGWGGGVTPNFYL